MDAMLQTLSDSSFDLVKLSIFVMGAVVMFVVAIGMNKSIRRNEFSGSMKLIACILLAEAFFGHNLLFMLLLCDPTEIRLTGSEIILLMVLCQFCAIFTFSMNKHGYFGKISSFSGYFLLASIAGIAVLMTVLAHPSGSARINYPQLIISLLVVIGIGGMARKCFNGKPDIRKNIFGFGLFILGSVGIQLSLSATVHFEPTDLQLMSHSGKDHTWLEVFLFIVTTMSLALRAVMGTNPRQHWRRYAVSAAMLTVMSVTMFVSNERSLGYSNTHFELARLTESLNAQRSALYLKTLQYRPEDRSTKSTRTIPADVFQGMQSYYENATRIDRLISKKSVGEDVRSAYLTPVFDEGQSQPTSLEDDMNAFYKYLKSTFGLQSQHASFSNVDQINFESRLNKLNYAIMAEVRTAAEVQDLIKDMALLSGLMFVSFLTFGVFIPAHKSTINALDALESEKARIYKLALCAEHTTKGIVLTDSLGKITWCNDAFRDITGFTVKALEGKTLLQATRSPKADIAELRRVYSDIENHRPTDVEVMACRKDGSDFWLSGSITPVIENGKLRQVVHVFNDVTEEREMRERLATAQAEAERLALIARTAPDGMAIRLADGTIGWLNPALEEMTGYTKDDLETSMLHELLRGPDSNADDIANMLSSMSLCEPFSGEFLCYRKDGKQYWIEASHTPFYEDDGSYGGFVITHRDITERKRLELELISHRDELAARVEERTQTIMNQSLELEKALTSERALNRMQTEFVSMASHEFRTPLTIIDGLARRLEKKADRWTPDDIREKAGTMRATVKRMTMLVERTLDASRLSSGRIKLIPETFDLRALVEEVCVRQRELASTHTIDIDLEHLPDTLFGDARLMDNIFTNIVSNAVKYAGENRYVKITGSTDEDYAVVKVRDRGIGIPKAEIEKIFQRFFRASTSTGIPGTGIGLNLVKSLVEMHYGEVSLDSEEGEWTEFTVRLPLESPLIAKTFDDLTAGETDHIDDQTAA